MILTISMLLGLGIGVGVFLATRNRAGVAAKTALVLGGLGTVLFLATINDWFLPALGRFGAIGIGIVCGVATVLALGAVIRGERKPINWIALAVSAPPVLFLIVFGIAELTGPPH